MTEGRVAYVSFFPSDWRGGTAGLPPLTEWVYLQICLHNWDKGEAVPERQLALLLGRVPEWAEHLELLIEIGKLTRSQNRSVWSRRALVEAKRSADALAKKTNAGKKGAAERWAGKTEPRAGARGGAEARAQGREPTHEEGENSPHVSKELNGTANAEAMRGQWQPESEPESEDAKASPPISPPAVIPAGDLAFEIPARAWAEFREHRIKLKAPMSPKAESLIMRNLERIWHETGQPPDAILEQSIERGWKGVFPIKSQTAGSGWDFTIGHRP